MELWYEPDNYAIRVRDKASGFIFGSSLDAKTVNLPFFNTKFEGIVNSAVVIKYYSYNETTGVYTTVEESMFESNLTTATFTAIPNGFQTAITFGTSGIGLTLEVYISGGDLHISVPNESITEGVDFKLRSVKIYSYFGAVYSDSVTGYLLVPDGSGALVRYREIDAVTDVYELNYYGTDIGLKNAVRDEASLSLPVFGMIHGISQHGFLGIIERGAAAASLVINPAKSNLRYYYTHPEFVYRQLYSSPTSQAAASEGVGRQVIQADINSLDVSLVYRFLDGEEANYVGMARAYQSYLLEEGVLTRQEATNGETPTHVELIGGERNEGFLTDETVVMTSIAEAKAILSDLKQTIGPLDVVYKGVFAGGYSGAGPKTTRLLRDLGSARDMLELQEEFNQDGHSFALYADWFKVFEAAPFNPYLDISQRINQRLLEGQSLTMRHYYMQPNRASDLFLANANQLLKDGFDHLALGTIGSTLYSDYKNGDLDRMEVEGIVQNMMSEYPGTLLLYRPFASYLAYIQSYLMAPVSTKNYQIYTDTIPFLSIVLAGTMNQFGGYLNFASDRRQTLLKMIDFNVFPSYILTERSSFLLQDTELGMLYSSQYATWSSEIAVNHAFINAVLQPVQASSIIARDVLAPGFVRVSYANGAFVYVNYSSFEQVDGLISVLPYSAKAVTPDA